MILLADVCQEHSKGTSSMLGVVDGQKGKLTTPMSAQARHPCKTRLIPTTLLYNNSTATYCDLFFFFLHYQNCHSMLFIPMSSNGLQVRANAAVQASMLGSGVREASRKWDVPRSYVRRRLEGVPTFKES